jgi:hypothetical protein
LVLVAFLGFLLFFFFWLGETGDGEKQRPERAAERMGLWHSLIFPYLRCFSISFVAGMRARVQFMRQDHIDPRTLYRGAVKRADGGGGGGGARETRCTEAPRV